LNWSDFNGNVSDIMLPAAPLSGTRPSLRAKGPRRRVAAAGRTLKPARAADVLGMRIVCGHPAPGERLPTESALSAQLGISRASLRQGLCALAQKGLVEGRTRRGTIVRERRHWNLLDPDVLRWLAVAPPDPGFFMDLLDVRMVIEPAAARLAATRAAPEQVAAIEAAFRGMVRSTPRDMEACCAHDLALHELIIAATGNSMLIRVAGAIRTALEACVRIASIGRETSAEYSLAEHRAVVVAIRRRDAEGAEHAMRTLLAGTARDLAPAYEKYPHGFPPPPAARTARGTPRRT
jgi:GntR family galactonate operon transcriptional repressor